MSNGSDSSEKPINVEELCKSLPIQHIVDIDFDTYTCVFRVPKSLTQTKPEAYWPQKLGLGPYHHLRPDLYSMQRKKHAAVMKFLHADAKLRDGIDEVMKDLTKQENQYSIRAFYDEYLDLDPSTLARILAVDAIYLRNYFDNYISSSSSSADDHTNPHMKKKLAADILMLENQIPGDILVDDIQDILQCWDNDAFIGNILSFCEAESPLQLMEKRFLKISHSIRQGHLLSVVYNLILPKSESDESKHKPKSKWTRTTRHRISEKAKQAAAIAAAIGFPGADIVQKELAIVEKVPWELMTDKLKKFDPDHRENCVPSASQLTQNAGIRFARTEKGIKGVRFDEGERKLYLPAITMHSNSEVVLRNLLAYEAALAKPGSTLELAEYVDLMCGVIDTAKDVEILRDAKITIKGDDDDFTDVEIARIFYGMRKLTGEKRKPKDKNKEKEKGKIEVEGENKEAKIREAIEKVNKSYDNAARVKAMRFVKKYCSISWNIIGVILSVMVVMLLVLQAFCLVYDCRSHWSVKSKYNPLQVI